MPKYRFAAVDKNYYESTGSNPDEALRNLIFRIHPLGQSWRLRNSERNKIAVLNEGYKKFDKLPGEEVDDSSPVYKEIE